MITTRRIVTIICIIFFAAVSICCADEKNLLKNGSFEQGTEQWYLDLEDAKVEIVEGQPGREVKSGSKAIRIKNNGGQSNYHQIGGLAGRLYELTFWARAGSEVSSKVLVNIYEYGDPDELVRKMGRFKFLRTVQKMSPKAVGSQWQKFKVLIKMGDDLAGAMHFNVAMGTQGDVVLDDIVLREIQTWQEALIFHLPFEDSFAPAYSDGNSSLKTNGEPTFTDGKKGKAAVFSDNANIIFEAGNNFDQSEGTLAMWVQPYWIATDGIPHCFFEVPVGPEMLLDGGFVITKGFSDRNTPDHHYLYNSPGHGSCMHNFGLESGEWTHLVFTWSSSAGTMSIYRNGELIGLNKGLNLQGRPSSKGRPMVIGARLGGKFEAENIKPPYYEGRILRDLPVGGAYGADAAIDELMIFNRVLTDTEIAVLSDQEPTGTKIAKEPERYDDSHWNKVELQLKTPHIKFNSPAVKPVKALFVTPAVTAPRDVVELSQRCDIDFEAVTTLRIDQLAHSGTFFRKWKGTTAEEKTKELLEKLERNPEVIVVGNFRFDKLPGQIQSKIREQVSAGAGLVVAFPRRLPADFIQSPDSTGRDQILEGIPLAGMPECFPGKDMTPEALAENVVKTFSYGKGRIVLLYWDENPPPLLDRGRAEGLIPCAFGRRWTRQYEHRYNYYLSLVGKAVQWAAGWEAKATWLKLPADGHKFQTSKYSRRIPVEIGWNGENEQTGILKAVIRDDRGRIGATEDLKINLKPGKNTFAVPLSQLKCGKHYLDFTLLASGKVQNCATVYFEVQGPEQIVSLTTDSDYYELDEAVKGKVHFRSAVPSKAELLIRAVDTNGRVYNRSNISVKAGDSEVEFQINVNRTTTLASYIEVDLITGGKVLSCGEKVIFVPKRESKEFLNVLWCSILNEGIGQVGLRQLRKAGFNAVYHWGFLDFHNDAMADMMPAQYCMSLVLMPDSRGWPTDDEFPGVEDYSFANPKIQENLRKLAKKSFKESGVLGPPFYSLGDEDRFRWGVGYSPYGLEYFREFLKKRYGTITKLNEVYGSNYADFKDVPRYKIGDAMAKGLIPALIDHRLATDHEWAEYFHFSQLEFKKLDPYALVGAEGSEPGDLERMLDGVGFWGPYHSKRDAILQRSLQSPDVLASHWWGGYGAGATDCTELWNGLICGSINFQEFFNAIGIEGSLNRDFSYRSFFEKILPELQEIYAGPALLLRDSEVIGDELVAIHYSRSSIHASLALNRLATPSGLDSTLVLAMDEFGQDFRYASGNQIAAGKLLTPQAKVLFMPASYTLSQAEAEGVAEFVRQGGTVIADVLPGVLDEFGRRLNKGRLDEVFGVTCNGKTAHVTAKDIDISVEINSTPVHFAVGRTSVDSALVVKSARPLAKTDEVPLLLTNDFGKGKAILLNFDLSRGPKILRTPFVKALLQVANVQPTYRLESPPTTKLSVLKRGDMTLVGVILPDGSDVPTRVSWDTPACVYNVRKGQYLGSVTEVSIPSSAEAGRVHLFTLQKEPVKGIDLVGDDKLIRGKNLRLSIHIDVGKVNPKDRLIRIDVTDPNGNLLQHYRDFVTLDGSYGESIIPFAFNDTTGTWTIRATDVATAVSTEKKVVLK